MSRVILSPLHRASRQISLYMEAQMRGTGLSPQEGHVITYLNTYAPCPVSELARVFGLKHSTLSSMLNRLGRDGFVDRQVNPGDRRSFLVTLTDSGRTIAGRLDAMVSTLEQDIVDRVSPAQLEGFAGVMRSIDEVTHVDVRERPREPGRSRS